MLSVPTSTHAGVFSTFSGKVKAIFLPEEVKATTTNIETSQTISLFKPVVVDDETSTSAEATDASSSESLKAVSGTLRVSTEDIDFPMNDTISVYEVKKGDTLTDVAKLFGVSKNTIIWANDLKSSKISQGDVLVILPMTGIRHTIKKGDTIASIAKKYKADIDDVAKFNGIASDTKLALGDTILVPEGEITVVAPPVKKVIVKGKILESYANTTPSGFLTRPLAGGTKTQGIHGHNAVDIAATRGTPVYAAASGKAIVVRLGSYNGGYGNMIVIQHANNVQTVYAHLQSAAITNGETVTQGQQIGLVGNTGRSTGPHLHFEVRGAKNPF